METCKRDSMLQVNQPSESKMASGCDRKKDHALCWPPLARVYGFVQFNYFFQGIGNMLNWIPFIWYVKKLLIYAWCWFLELEALNYYWFSFVGLDYAWWWTFTVYLISYRQEFIQSKVLPACRKKIMEICTRASKRWEI